MRIVVLFFLLHIHFLWAQQPHKSIEIAIVNTQNIPYLYPWTGGCIAPQFNNIDLNNDNVQDLVLFNSIDSSIITLLQENGILKHSIQYENFFPNDISGFLYLIDIDNDNDSDIITCNQNYYVKVYENIGNNFILKTDSLKDINQSYILIDSRYRPIFRDVDNDCDMDIITLDIDGFANYYKNLSYENTQTCNQLLFSLSNICWGSFRHQGITNGAELNQVCPNSLPYLLHGGFSLEMHDVDNNSHKDILISDANFKHITALYSNGNQIVSQDTFYKNNLKVGYSPQFKYIDINGDNIDELLVSSNNNYNNNIINAELFMNNSPISTEFFTNETIKLGKGAQPVLYDINNDGLKDLFISNFEKNNFKSQVYYFKNIGTANVPRFKLQDTNYVQLRSLNQYNLSITFGDVSGDNLPDLLVGCANGYLKLYKNIGTTSNPNFEIWRDSLQLFRQTFDAKPFLFDVDNDNLLDIICSYRNGLISLYRNIGTATNPIFTNITNSWGNVNSTPIGEIFSSNNPVLAHENGILKLYVGNQYGGVQKYGNIESNLFSGSFVLESPNYLHQMHTSYSMVTVADVDNDNSLDFIVGNIKGGIEYYTPQFLSSVFQPKSDVKIKLSMAGNTISVTNTGHEDKYFISIYTNDGKEIISKSSNRTFNITQKGLYYLLLSDIKGNSQSLKFIIR